MKTEDAISHLRWKFTQSNSKASKKDKESLNAIINTLNKQDATILNDNVNLCKLLIYSFKKMVLTNAINNNYKQVDYVNIYSKLKDIFMMNAKSHIDSLHSELEGIEMQCLIDNKNLTGETIKQLTTKKEVDRNIRKMLKEFINYN